MKMLSAIGSSFLLVLAASPLAAAPVGYSINSDSAGSNADSLYRVDLGTGAVDRVGPMLAAGESRIDIEGLAFSPEGVLWGIDDASMTLFPIDTTTALVRTSEEVRVNGLQAGGGNDFGMTFTCDGSLFVTSVSRRTLYRLALDGSTVAVGGEGNLGANIGALAAYGEPAQIYGLGNGLDQNLREDAPSLFRIDPVTGVATEIGPLGAGVGDYAEGGLSFDDAGQLWAVTDRRDSLGGPSPSEAMMIDTASGAASGILTLGESGFESLAITVPGGCTTDDGGGDDDGGDDGGDDVGIDDPGIPTLSFGGLAILLLLVLGTAAVFLRRP